jgi:hypothetical protein
MKPNICAVLGYPAGSKLRNLNPTYAGYLIHNPKEILIFCLLG